MSRARNGHSTARPRADGHHRRPAGPPAAVDHRAEGRRRHGERSHGEEEVQQDLVLGLGRGDGEEQRAGQRHGEHGVARRHQHMGQGQPPERPALVEQVGDGRPGQAAELVTSLPNAHRQW